MAKCSERVVNAAVNQGKVACFHEDCKESYKFFKEDGIVHHFKTTHHRKNITKTEDRRPKTEDRRSKTEDRKTKSSLILGLSNSRQL